MQKGIDFMINAKVSRFSYLTAIIFSFSFLGAFGLCWLFHDGMAWSDFPVQWRVCAYTLRGIDIYALRGGGEVLQEIGAIRPGFHASPWGCLLQNIFYGGFLSFKSAGIYFVIVNAAVVILASLILFTKLKTLSPNTALCAFIISVMSADFFSSLDEGNAGGMICAFLLTACILDDMPYISGVLIAFAMVKPQDALIVCIALLIMKRLKPLVIAAVIDISAWGIVSIMTHKGMIELLREFLFMPAEKVSRPPFAGIFTLLIDEFMPAAVMSMLAGLVFVIILLVLLPKDMPEMFRIYPAFAAVTFWCYSYSNDCYILVLPASLCIYLMFRSKKVFHGILWLLCGTYFITGLHFRSITARVLMFVNSGLSYTTAHVYARTFYELGIIAASIIICFALRSIYGGSKS